MAPLFEEFQEDCSVIAVGVNLRDEGAQTFLQKYPLHLGLPPWLLNGLPSAPRGFDSTLSNALEKIFATPSGATALLSAVPVLQQAVQAPQPQIRRLATGLLGQVLLQSPESQAQLIPSLLDLTLHDPETSVYAAARTALVHVAAIDQAHGQRILGHSVVADAVHSSENAITETRALELVLATLEAAGDPALAAWAEGQGLLRALDEFLPADRDEAPSDILGLLSAFEVVKDMVGQSKSGSLAARILTRQSDRLLRCALNGDMMAIVRGKAVQLAASCTVNSLQHCAADATNGLQLLEAVGHLLTPGQSEEELQAAIADALSDMTAHSAAAAAAFIISCPTALHALCTAALQHIRGSMATPAAAVKISAMHALASLLGASRDLLAIAPEGPTLGYDAEAKLSACVFSVLREGRWTLLDTFRDPLRRGGVTEYRVAAYRLLSAAVRRPWAVLELCTDRELMTQLLDPASETGVQGPEFRYAVVSALYASLLEFSSASAGTGAAAVAVAFPPESLQPALVVLSGWEAQIGASRARGPFGTGAGAPAGVGRGSTGGHAIPTVMAERRG